ncbi:MAG: cysteine hydrolase [Chloroflexi bacterium]|nr:cysteine hydrolase [Chloroflexota bacterium]
MEEIEARVLRTLEEKVDPGHAALVVVDVQNDFCHWEGALAKRGEDVSDIQAMVPNLLRLIDRAREEKVPIVFVQMVSSPWTISPVALERRLRFQREYRMSCQEGSWGAEFYQVRPQPGEVVVVKHRHSAFVDTDLELILRSRGIKTLIMTGVATNVCVESTARDGFMKDFYIVFVSDGAACTSREAHQATLRNIENHYGAVVTVQEVMTAWAKKKAAAPQVAAS